MWVSKVRILLLIVVIAVSNVSNAELDEHQKKGLKDTQDLLRNKKAREKAIGSDAKAKEADAKAGALAGSPENKEEMYDLAAQVMDKITTEANGDPEKMQALMLEAQKNPKAFYEKYFTAEQKANLRNLANKIEKSQQPVSSPK
jgi:hypothetical protein